MLYPEHDEWVSGFFAVYVVMLLQWPFKKIPGNINRCSPCLLRLMFDLAEDAYSTIKLRMHAPRNSLWAKILERS
jgi:hypothetical protein